MRYKRKMDEHTKLGLILFFSVMLTFTVGSIFLKPTDSRGAKKAVASLGMMHIDILGVALFKCDISHTYATAFRAIDSRGQPVEGAVCALGYTDFEIFLDDGTKIKLR